MHNHYLVGFIKERTDPREIASSCSYRALLEISPWRSTISQRIHERRTPKRKGYIQLIPNPVHQNRSGRAPATKIPKLVPKPHPKVLIRIILFLRSPQLLLHRIQIIIITALCSSYRVLCFQSQEPDQPLLEPSSSLVFLPRERWRRSKLFAATVLRSAP